MERFFTAENAESAEDLLISSVNSVSPVETRHAVSLHIGSGLSGLGGNMRVVTAELLLRRLTDTIESGLSPQMPTPYLRSQGIAIVSLLSNLAERMEERAELLAPGSLDMRNILEESLEILSPVKGAGTAIKPIKATLGMTSTSLIEESAALRQALYQAIEALYRWEKKLDDERLDALRIRIRVHLRRQLDQDLAIYRPVRAGKMLRGEA